jgi:two-component system, chemotaxis family, protein-glutamate methylesterase/glutaminase
MTTAFPLQLRPTADRVIAIATSAGGLTALIRLLGSLPAALGAAVLVVQHLQASRPSYLPEILRRHTPLRVFVATHGARLEMGAVYVAPPDVHLMIRRDRRLELSRLPPLHFCRPSGDRLFASIGPSFGSDGIAVVLTGAGCDGAEGAQVMRRQGGMVIVQDLASAAFGGMPGAAVRAGGVDRVLPLGDIAAALEGLVGTRGVG